VLNLPKSLIRDGLVFIWVEKEINFYINVFMEAQGFVYVENFAWLRLNPKMKEGKFTTLTDFLFRNRGTSEDGS
jgi:hypothetical protein